MIYTFNKQFIYYLFINSLFIKSAISHSWVSCTDYQLSNEYPKDITNNNSYTLTNSINYDINKCLGFGRNYQLQHISDINRGFGFDTGYNFRSTECKYQYDSNYYSSNIPMAKYTPGSTICLTYPSKNHVAATCTSKDILDNGVKIFRSTQKLTDNFDKEYNHLNGQHQKETIDYKGFHNCPGFCNNMDKTVCYMCFNLESDIESGIHSFKWVWEYNPGEFYSTCWDAEIIDSKNNTPNTNNLDEPCGLRRLNSISYKYQKNLLCSGISGNTPTMVPSNPIPTDIPINNPTPVANPIPVENPTPVENPIPVVNPTTDNNSQSTKKKCIPKESEQSGRTESLKDSEIINGVETWGQCGGGNMPNKQCNNSVCIKYSPYYSQCLPYELEKYTLCGQNDNNEIKWMHDKCKSGLKCIQMPGSSDYRCI